MTVPSTFAQASKQLLRSTLLDGLRDLLREHDWARITMAGVARHAGVSRQTVYNEFGSRHGLAQAYALRLVDDFTSEIADGVAASPGDLDAALTSGFSQFFVAAASDPLIASLVSGEGNADLHRLVTTEAAPLIESAKSRLVAILEVSWIELPDQAATRIAGSIARMALSYVAMPPETEIAVVAADLAGLFGPAIREASGGTLAETPQRMTSSQGFPGAGSGGVADTLTA